ncbi:MAG: putative DNA binding domain-containing protein [Candidatus Poribacteria bacterium]|nr:putative DNA binding domain-containing protein [Candidatus Poribacteria bacterium]
MDTIIRKKVILCLIDCDSKSANEIAAEIGESLTTIEEQLTELASENICKKINQDEISQYIVKKDIETFAPLVKEFLSEKGRDKEQIEQFITSEYYFTRIDFELVDYVLKRFYLDWDQTNEGKEGIRRILLASPSALSFALHGETEPFRESWAHQNRLNPSEKDLERIIGITSSGFMTPLLEMLIDDVGGSLYSSLHDKLQIRMIKRSIQVSLATPYEKYVEAIGGEITTFARLVADSMEDPRPGQLVSLVNPIDYSDDGLAHLHLGEFQGALDSFDKALDKVQDPTQRAIVLNNKGLAFLRTSQYQKAIECFEEGIVLDSEGEISELRENKQIAQEYLARATDADNLTDPTQVRFVQEQPIPFEETLFYEFKEIRGGNPVDSITNTADEYAVAFLNSEGGRIFWGIRDSDRVTVGVLLDERQRDDVRRKVSEKLWGIRPPISDEDWQLELHQIYDLHGETIKDLWVVELVISPQQQKEVFYTNSGELFVKTPGGKQKLLGPQVTEFILSRFQSDTETD